MSDFNWYPLLLLVHVAGVVVWVGGMFFAYVCLRPVAAQLLAPEVRLPLWRQVLQRFFAWVWVAVVLIPASGGLAIALMGMPTVPLRWRLMMFGGTAMIAIFVYVYVAPYRALQRAVDAQDWRAGGAALARIRHLVGINLILGFATIADATAGRLFE
jgi:uncharacterized membrane protein